MTLPLGSHIYRGEKNVFTHVSFVRAHSKCHENKRLSRLVHGSLLSLILTYFTPLTVQVLLSSCHISAGSAEMFCHYIL